ncbi:MAG TPA: phage major tail tube protein [Novosphingobium capsulatum]|jgi:P2 family phage contractile tail tube protein|nr:phage major tail tube protein [Novosphingobium capsulatum]
MGLPRTLQNLMLFNEGQSYVGEVKTVTLPTLTRKLEEYRGGGMSAPVKLDMGMEALEMKSVFGGPERAMLRQFGVVRVNGVYLRFVGFYQQQDTGQSDTIEIVVRGRHSEIEMGDQELGSAADFTVTSALAYYKLIWNGRTEIEIDPLNMVQIVDGVDLMAQQRSALGLF